MRSETRIVTGEQDIPVLIAWLKVHLTNTPLEIRVSTPKQTRSMKQHRLYWLWVTEIANHLGLFKDEIHEMLKRKFAVPIFTRDNPGYAEMVIAVKAIRKHGMTDHAESLAREISRLTSTTDFTVEQMSEYLNDIEHFAAEKGVELTFPEDLYASR